jgi:hypothetical protein
MSRSIVEHNMVSTMINELKEFIQYVAVFCSPIFWIATLIVYTRYNTGLCDGQHLEKTVLAYCILELGFFVATLEIIRQASRQPKIKLSNCTHCLNIGNLVWFIVGWCYLYYRPICNVSDPHMYNMLLAILIQKSVIIWSDLIITIAAHLCAGCMYVTVYGILFCLVSCLPLGFRRNRTIYSGWTKTVLKAQAFSNLNRAHLNDSNCGICLEEFQPTSQIRALPCTEAILHVFCLPCIDKWFKVNNTCPYCRVIYNQETYNSFNNRSVIIIPTTPCNQEIELCTISI